MFGIFLIIFIAFFHTEPSFAANENNRILSIEEINADLEKRKKALEPFNSEDVKVDLESLGLDDVSKKPEVLIPLDKKSQENPEPKITEEAKPQIIKPIASENSQEKELPPIDSSNSQPIAKEEKLEEKELLPIIRPEIKKTEIKEENLKESPAKEDVGAGVMSRIKNLLNTEINKKLNEETPQKQIKEEVKEPKKEFINPQKKKNLKKLEDLKKQKRWDQDEEKKRLKNLSQLRKKYLNSSDDSEDVDSTLNYLDSSEDIIPYRKNLDKFLVEETPAPPILDYYRTRDNIHIPFILTPKERLDILFEAISTGNIGTFNEVYNHIKNPNAINNFGDTILTYSILLKKYPIIVSILSKGADPDMPNQLGYTPVNIALELGDFRALEILANNKANLNYIDIFGRNYLMHASRIGILPAVKLFIDRGIDINAMDNDGFTALAIAYKHQQNIVATYLLKHGAKTWVERPYNPQERSIIKELENSWK